MMMEPATEVIELTQLAAPKRPAFGEFLVSHHVLDRFQLFRALQMQDRMPRTRIGQCAVALGYTSRGAVEHLHVRFTAALADTLEDMTTEAFVREHEPEILIELAC
jgi:hypothetical protein